MLVIGRSDPRRTCPQKRIVSDGTLPTLGGEALAQGTIAGQRQGVPWIHEPLALALLRRKHALPILLYLHAAGQASTSELIRQVHGHPAAIIDSLRMLVDVGAVVRCWLPEGRRTLQSRLTLRGMQLVETPVYRWDRLIKHWKRVTP